MRAQGAGCVLVERERCAAGAAGRNAAASSAACKGGVLRHDGSRGPAYVCAVKAYAGWLRRLARLLI